MHNGTNEAQKKKLLSHFCIPLGHIQQKCWKHKAAGAPLADMNGTPWVAPVTTGHLKSATWVAKLIQVLDHLN